MRGGFDIDTRTDVVPIINVSLVVVLTLMIISPFLDQSEHGVDLPEAHASEADDAQKVEISYTLDGRIFIEELEVGLDEVEPILAEVLAAEPHTTAVIKADRSLAYGEVEKLIARVEASQAPRVAIATRNEDGTEEPPR